MVSYIILEEILGGGKGEIVRVYLFKVKLCKNGNLWSIYIVGGIVFSYY